MENIERRVGLIANIAFILICIVFGTILIQRQIFPSARAHGDAARTLPVGSRVELADEEWNHDQATLLLVLQKGCRFCSESAEFYRKLVPITKEKNIRIVAVMPTPPDESRDYLRELGIDSAEVKQAPLASLNIRGTPTIILTNERGEVVNSWIGLLSSDQQSKLITSL